MKPADPSIRPLLARLSLCLVIAYPGWTLSSAAQPENPQKSERTVTAAQPVGNAEAASLLETARQEILDSFRDPGNPVPDLAALFTRLPYRLS